MAIFNSYVSLPEGIQESKQAICLAMGISLISRQSLSNVSSNVVYMEPHMTIEVLLGKSHYELWFFDSTISLSTKIQSFYHQILCHNSFT